jgi:hypothetical protein
MKFQLNSNINVAVDSFKCTGTYLTVLSARLPGIINEKLVKEVSVPIDWGGHRKLLLLPPTAEQLNSVLPPYCYYVWLNSDYQISTDDDGSGLVVAFFGESPFGIDLKDLFQTKLENINWEENAEAFNF